MKPTSKNLKSQVEKIMETKGKIINIDDFTSLFMEANETLNEEKFHCWTIRCLGSLSDMSNKQLQMCREHFEELKKKKK